MIIGDKRLSATKQSALFSPDSELLISPVVAFEFADLKQRRRIPVDESLSELEHRFGIEMITYPVDAWRLAEQLPSIHGDPVDRMLVAHALTEDLTIVTADANIHRYPVPCI